MTDYREINELAKSPARCQALASFLKQSQGVDWTDWELDFLEAIAGRDEVLTTRQAEKLVEIRNNAIRYKQVSGYALARLVRDCFVRRLDLDGEEDIAFVEGLHQDAAAPLTRPQALRLKRCATELGLVEPHTVWTFPVPALARF
jgi:hypothetical protein